MPRGGVWLRSGLHAALLFEFWRAFSYSASYISCHKMAEWCLYAISKYLNDAFLSFFHFALAKLVVNT